MIGEQADRQTYLETYLENESLTSVMTVQRVESPSQFPKAGLKNEKRAGKKWYEGNWGMRKK